MDRDSKRFTPFVRGMILYAAVFIIILCLLLVFFNFFLSSYEKSRPANTVNSYLSGVNDERVKYLSTGLISKVSPDVQSDEQIMSVVGDALKGCVAAKNKKESSSAELSYYLEKDGTPVEHITLIQGAKGPFGFAPWIVAREELIEDSFIGTKEFVIPDSYSIIGPQGALGQGHITSEGLKFDMLNGFYDSFENLPVMNSYSTGPYVGDVEFTVTDQNGKDVSKEVEQIGVYCLDNCSPETKTEVESFAEEYVRRDVTYRSGATGNISDNLNYLLSCIEYPSELYKLVQATLQGYGFTAGSSRGDYIQSLNIDHCMDCGNGLYCCDISYQVETVSKHGTTNSDFEYKLMIHRQEDGTLKAIGMSYS